MADIDPRQVREMARVFAEAFAASGQLQSGGTAGDNSALGQFKEFEEQEKALERSNDALKEYATAQNNLNEGIGDTDKQTRRRAAAEKILNKDSILLGQSFTSAASALREQRLDENVLNDFLSETSFDQLNANFNDRIDTSSSSVASGIKKGGKKIRGSLKGLAKNIDSFKASKIAAVLLDSFTRAAKDLSSGLKHGVDLSQNVLEKQFNAGLLGLSHDDFNELDSRNRSLISAMGGASTFQSELIKTSHAYFASVGDLKESTIFASQIMGTLKIAGAGTANALLDAEGNVSNLGKTFDYIQRLGGETFAQQAASLEQFVLHEETRTKLIAAGNAQERKYIIDRRLATKELLLGLNLTATQAKAAADALHGLGGKSAKDRLKESIKTEAVARSLGIEDADILGKAVRLGGTESFGKEEMARFTEAAKQLGTLQAGTFSGEAREDLATGALFEKLGTGLDGILKSFAEISTVSDDEKTLAQTTADKTVTAIHGSSDAIKVAINGLQIKEMVVAQATTNGFLNSILGSVNQIAGKSIKEIVSTARTNAIEGASKSIENFDKNTDAVGAFARSTLFTGVTNFKNNINEITDGFKNVTSSIGNWFSDDNAGVTKEENDNTNNEAMEAAKIDAEKQRKIMEDGNKILVKKLDENTRAVKERASIIRVPSDNTSSERN